MEGSFYTPEQTAVLIENSRLAAEAGLVALLPGKPDVMADSGHDRAVFRSRFNISWVELSLEIVSTTRSESTEAGVSIAAVTFDLEAYPASRIRFKHIRLCVSRLAVQAEHGLWLYRDPMAGPLLDAYQERILQK